MSFGKLNILMHKSWNVWNRDNVEKVLRDERLHREEESKKRQRTDEVESESRTQLLRAKRAAAAEAGVDVGGAAAGPGAGAQPALLSLADKFSAPESAPRTEGGGMPVAACTGAGQGVGDSGSAASSAHRGFSIFAGLEHELDAAAGNDTAQGSENRDAMEEKRKEKEKLDRQWGLVGLGQDSYTGQMASAKPWYASKQPPNAAAFDGLNTASAPHGAAPFGIQRSAEEKVAKDARNKARADPVADMNKYLGKTRRHKEEKKKHRHDSDRRGSRHKGTGDTGLSEAEKRAKLEKLRSERLAREAGERARVAEIMGMGRTGNAAQTTAAAARTLTDDYRSGYSSGFASFHGGLVRDKNAPQHQRWGGGGGPRGR